MKGCRGEGGAEEEELSKRYSRVSVKRRRAEALYPSPDAISRTHKARGLGAIGSSSPW